MKKFKVTWYSGTIEHITEVLKEIVLEAEDISSVDVLSILPDKDREKILYTRGLIYSPEHYVYDYGSYTKFINVEEEK